MAGRNPNILLDLNQVNLDHTDLGGANLSGADLSDATLMGATLSGANLSRANLDDATYHAVKIAVAGIRSLMNVRETAGSLNIETLSKKIPLQECRPQRYWHNKFNQFKAHRRFPGY